MIRSSVRCSLIAFVVMAVFGPACFLVAQDSEDPAVRGTIVAVQLPDGFDVNGCHVVTSSGTRFVVLNGSKQAEGEPSREIAIGDYVEVVGEKDRRTHVITARQVRVRQDGERKVREYR